MQLSPTGRLRRRLSSTHVQGIVRSDVDRRALRPSALDSPRRRRHFHRHFFLHGAAGGTERDVQRALHLQPQGRTSFANRPLEGGAMGIPRRGVSYVLLRRRLVPADETRAEVAGRLSGRPFPVGGRRLHNGSAGAGGEHQALQWRRVLFRGAKAGRHWENASLVLSAVGPNYVLENPDIFSQENSSFVFFCLKNRKKLMKKYVLVKMLHYVLCINKYL